MLVWCLVGDLLGMICISFDFGCCVITKSWSRWWRRARSAASRSRMFCCDGFIGILCWMVLRVMLLLLVC